MKPLANSINPGIVLIVGAILIVLCPLVGGVIGLFGVGFARGAHNGALVGSAFAVLALTAAAIASRVQKRDKEDHA